MNKKLLLIILVLLTTFLVACTSKTTEQTIAENWIKTGSTYANDGYDLEFLSQEANETNSEQQILKYSFISKYEGYGDRSGSVQVQKPTPHTITLYLSGKDVIFAEIDNAWDELNEKILYPEEIKFKGQPAKCVDTPWETWYKKGNIQYITEPTDEQLITDFYASQNIEILRVWNIPLPALVCSACNFCPRGYTLIIKINDYDTEKILDDGWVYNNDTKTGNILFSDSTIQIPVKQ